jgi:hypothetical protein
LATLTWQWPGDAIAAIAKVAIGKSERQMSRGENGMATYPGYRPNANKLDPSGAALQERRFKESWLQAELTGLIEAGALGRLGPKKRYKCNRGDFVPHFTKLR